MLRIEIAETAKPEETEFIAQQLLKFNHQCVSEENYNPLIILLRNMDEELLGGLIGSTYYEWLCIEILWVDESHRRSGYGDALLATAEREAIQRGCKYAYLDTFSFQAPEFYQKRGYIIFGELPDFPTGHRRYFLKKVLGEAQPSPRSQTTE
ncbi:MAG: GNAT family N-acetyltransferase [Coleofasciculaceae cyanobacterium SM2_3_26]|nr:GNAT family N-acetyltransferase [Coleofasciculaceae cyanobacterium SM2_3_26]